MQKEITVSLTEDELSKAALRYVAENMGLSGKVRGVVRFNASQEFGGRPEFSATVKISDD